MPIESPILDDLEFEEIVARLRSRIPIHTEEWTDHNESDPGITLIQLFASLAEQLGYRLNQVPDKNRIEFLKLVGIHLAPAEPARTFVQLVLSRPEAATARLLPAASRIRASTGDPPPVFETDEPLDLVPAQLAALVSSSKRDLRELRAASEPGPQVGEDPETYVAERFTLVWDGKKPKPKDLPTQPLALFQAAEEAKHTHLFVGLAFNPSPSAGFVGQRVTLHLVLDDDEQPDPAAIARCGEPELELESSDPAEPLVEYEYFRPAQSGELSGTWRPLRVLSDGTQGWTRSGAIRFDVPASIGPIPDGDWKPVIGAPDPIPHPLVGALKTPVSGAPSEVPISGWLHVAFVVQPSAATVRALGFNAVAASHAESVQGESLGIGDGRPAQSFRLAHGNVLADSLELLATDLDTGLFAPWREVEDFDAAGPFDLVYTLDREAGRITFGDGDRGMPLPAEARVLARRYRHGGGLAGELPVGKIDQLESPPPSVTDAVNVVAARGGKEAEALEHASRRAPSVLKAQGRAVTREDFELFALRTPGVRIARAVVLPLRLPYPRGSDAAPGVDLETVAPGVVSVVVVPDASGFYPTPTESMLRAVCEELDRRRLVTTEVYALSPQYVRLFDLVVRVKSAPGFSRALLQESIRAELERSFHVLTGGPSGEGFPFGSTLHHADLVACVFRVEGVVRVEELEAWYDGFAPEPEGGEPRPSWRPERATPRRLTACPQSELDDDRFELAADENVFVDGPTLNVVVT